jgi:hypothetical protein
MMRWTFSQFRNRIHSLGSVRTRRVKQSIFFDPKVPIPSPLFISVRILSSHLEARGLIITCFCLNGYHKVCNIVPENCYSVVCCILRLMQNACEIIL